MIRRYTDAPIDAATVQDLLGAAVRAPSPHNRQPWRFAIVRGAARARLARAMGDQLRADLSADGVPPDQIEQDASRSYQRITSTQVGIVACLSMQEMDTYPDARRNEAERWMAAQAVAAAVQNLLLRATELGLGACWMCAPLFCPQAVRNALNLPLDWEPQALITLGHPADSGKERARKPLSEVTREIGD
jgi:F420 biosynthesis protein FbiB-like protein